MENPVEKKRRRWTSFFFQRDLLYKYKKTSEVFWNHWKKILYGKSCRNEKTSPTSFSFNGIYCINKKRRVKKKKDVWGKKRRPERGLFSLVPPPTRDVFFGRFKKKKPCFFLTTSPL